MTTQHLPSKWAAVRQMGLFTIDLVIAWAVGVILAATVFGGLWAFGIEALERIHHAYLWAGGCCGSAFLGDLVQTLISLSPLSPFAVGVALWWRLGRPRWRRFIERA